MISHFSGCSALAVEHSSHGQIAFLYPCSSCGIGASLWIFSFGLSLVCSYFSLPHIRFSCFHSSPYFFTQDHLSIHSLHFQTCQYCLSVGGFLFSTWLPATVTCQGKPVPYLVALLIYSKYISLTWYQIFWCTWDDHWNTCSILRIIQWNRILVSSENICVHTQHTRTHTVFLFGLWRGHITQKGKQMNFGVYITIVQESCLFHFIFIFFSGFQESFGGGGFSWVAWAWENGNFHSYY